MTKNASPRLFGSIDPFFEGDGRLGRTVANEEFFRALVSAEAFDAYHFFLPDRASMDHLSARLARAFPKRWEQGVFQVRSRYEMPRAMQANAYHCFHLSDCVNAPAYVAALRNRVSEHIFPVTSLTHSLSYARYMRDFTAHLWPGCTPRDVVVATSATAVGVMETIYAQIMQGFGMDPARTKRPQLARIPLGVDTERHKPPGDAERESVRNELGYGKEEGIVLVFGRICRQSKADVLPVVRAMLRSKDYGVETGRARLVVAGGMGDDPNSVQTVRVLAINAGLRMDVHADPDEDMKRRLFQAADVFCSPVDNPQETFGIAVLEAGAFGVPAVVSDYDGYKDLVVHGETGVRIPTLGPAGDICDGLPSPLLFDNHIHFHAAQSTVVDTGAMAAGIARLLGDEALRKGMGQAARRRVEEYFSWPRVVEMYLELWERLWDEPLGASRESIPSRHPMDMRHAEIFSGYPTKLLTDEVVVRATTSGKAVHRGLEHPVIYAGIEDLIDPEDVRKLLFFARKDIPLSALKEKTAAAVDGGRDLGFLAAWCLKHDLLEILEQPGGQA